MRQLATLVIFCCVVACAEQVTQGEAPQGFVPRGSSIAPTPECATLDHLAEAVAFRPEEPPARMQRAGAKSVRGTFRGVRNSLKGDRVILRWGNGKSFDSAVTERTVRAAESAWTLYVDTIGMPIPDGSDQYYLNMYIGNTGDGTPKIPWAAGYVTYDSEGFPYLVLNPDYLGTPGYENYIEQVVTHEFFHILQHSARSYSYGGSSGLDLESWYWEATAEWAAAHALPHNSYILGFSGAYMMRPDLPLYSFDYATSGTMKQLHQYGAGAFIYYLTGNGLVTPEDIRASWTTAGRKDDPISVLSGIAGTAGVNLVDAFGEFAAHLVAFDVPAGKQIKASRATYVRNHPHDDYLVTGVASLDPGEDIIRVDVDAAPRSFGFSVIELDVEHADLLRLELAPDDSGVSGPDTRAYVVMQTPAGKATYTPFVASGGVLGAEIHGVRAEDKATVVVSRFGTVGIDVDGLPFTYQSRALLELFGGEPLAETSVHP